MPQGFDATSTTAPADLGLGILFERSLDAVMVLAKADGRVILWNPAAERLFGYSAEEAVGRPAGDLLGLRGSDSTWQAPADFEAAGQASDGRCFAMRLNVTSLSEGSEHLLVIARELTVERSDGTDQKQLLGLVIDSLPGSVSLVDNDLVIRLVNADYAARYGGCPADFVDRSLRDIFPPQVSASLAEQVRTIRESGTPWRGYAVPDTQTGGSRDFIVSPVRSADGAIAGFLSLSYDVTERLKLERELTAQRALLARIVSHMSAGLFFVDRDLRVVWANPAHLAMIDREEAEFVGRQLHEVFPGAEEQVEAPLRRVLDTREPRKSLGASLIIKSPAGERLTYWDSEALVVEDERGAVEGVLVTALEVTDRVERERLQKERIATLEESSRLKEQFLSILSHELRTPINAIMGFASVLADGVGGALQPDHARFMERILAASDRLLGLVDDLLDMSRIQAGQFSLAMGEVVFHDVVRQVLDTLAPLAAQRGQLLCADLAPGLPTLGGDAQRLVQVLLNLAANAVKFTPEGGTIVIRATHDGAWLECLVQDSGPGIAPEQHDRIFERFTQLDMSNSRPAAGTGLGLSIAKALVEAHAGSIGVRSEHGRGSTFWFRLPVQAL